MMYTEKRQQEAVDMNNRKKQILAGAMAVFMTIAAAAPVMAAEQKYCVALAQI